MGGASILLAEDNATSLAIMTTMLDRMGHGVVVASDGVEAVRLAAAREFDLILMDVMMPGMGGLEATATLRRRGVYTPIVAMTAADDAADREACIAAGMDGHITKPVGRAELAEAIALHRLGGDQGAAEPDTSIVSRGGPPAARPTRSSG